MNVWIVLVSRKVDFLITFLIIICIVCLFAVRALWPLPVLCNLPLMMSSNTYRYFADVISMISLDDTLQSFPLYHSIVLLIRPFNGWATVHVIYRPSDTCAFVHFQTMLKLSSTFAERFMASKSLSNCVCKTWSWNWIWNRATEFVVDRHCLILCQSPQSLYLWL